VVLRALVHMLVQLLNVIVQKTSLNWSQIANCGLIASQKLVKLVNVAHVVLFLKSDVDDCLWYLLSNSA